MQGNETQAWIDSLHETVQSYRRMIDATVEQLSDNELRCRARPDMNSVAVILRHLGGNLRSRWTDFLTMDGEKPDRNRDLEFMDWEGDRPSLMEFFDQGWQALVQAIRSIDASNIDTEIFIRGESHTIPEALTRSITHLTYHVGQITFIARLVHDGQWNWMTIPPGGSAQHNNQTWGSAASRGVFGEKFDADRTT